MIPDNKVHGANMGPIWGRQDPIGPHVGPMNFAIWDTTEPTESPYELSVSILQIACFFAQSAIH